MNRTFKLSLLSFGAGVGASLGLFFGLRYLVSVIQHGGIW